jgi:hypothetical protein
MSGKRVDAVDVERINAKLSALTGGTEEP